MAVHNASTDTHDHGQEHDHAAHSDGHGNSHGDTSVFLGRTFPFPIYTVVFGVLAAITIVEVIISELPEGFIGNLLLLVLSGIKAVLVVLYYMHLKEDSRVFAIVLIIPLLIALVALLFLMSVPIGNY